MLIAANLAATVLRFLLFRAWVFPDRRDERGASTVVASHNPASPTYGTTSAAHPQYQRAAAAPAHAAAQRPTATAPPAPYINHDHNQTDEFRAGEAADPRLGGRNHAAAGGAPARSRPEGRTMTTQSDTSHQEGASLRRRALLGAAELDGSAGARGAAHRGPPVR